MPALTTVVGSFLGALAAGVDQEIAADLLKERTIDRWLDARINHDVQEALRQAFAQARVGRGEREFTMLWQVSGRSELPFDEMVLLDIYYVENWSPALDAKILLRTVPI